MKLYNTMTRKKEEFVPLEDNKVKIYSCGPTVYNYFHIGNARPFIIFDCLRRYFEYRGYDVTFVQNYTDIDDKMINRANEEGITVKELADRFIKEYEIDAKGLGIRPASVHPKATEHIDDIIAFIKTLMEKGYAYEAGGDVYYDTSKNPEYGKLSNKNLDELELGARIEVDDRKRNPMDFVLWKAKKENEPYWNSPWGEGRPGWHIECSVMSMKYLGDTIDIHCGGADLVFPHHENEIAQSESATGKTFARYWLHNGFININNEKMSKSKGNFFTVRDIVKHFDYEVLRFFMLSAHYRSPINFSDELLQQAEKGLDRIYECLLNLKRIFKEGVTGGALSEELVENLKGYKEKFIEAMDDDLNTADAVSVLFEMVRYANGLINGQALNPAEAKVVYDLFKELGGVLGLLGNEKDEDEDIDQKIKDLIEKRQEARKNKNWAEADAIRDRLKEMGIVLEDTPQGVRWKRI
ncbi:MAG: cysteine--tRNA ligase [Clostridia bacterium]|jgi:cysteinyl-tRNA synthetase|nr:cysteine--tRNA ligase [Clostridiaceae bacterium]